MKRALMIAVAACGYTPAGPPHAEPDAGGVAIQPPADAPPNAVSVVVTRDGLPIVDAPVYFQNRDSSLVVATTTDHNGAVGAQMAEGGFVTVVVRAKQDGILEDAVDRVTTFGDVEVGDILHVDVRSPPGTTGVEYDTTIDPGSLVAGASSYVVFSACSDEPIGLDGSGSGKIALIGCGASTDLVIVAVDAFAAPLSAAYVADQALAPGTDPPMTDAAPFPTAPLSLTPSFGPLVTTTMTVHDAPATAGFFKGYQAVLSADGKRLFEKTAGATMAAGTAQVTLQRPRFDDPAHPGAQLTLDSADLAPNADGVGEQLVYQWGPSSGAYDLAASSVLLPEYLRLPSFDKNTINWSEGPAATAADLVRVTILGSRPAVPASHPWTWQVVAARGTSPSLVLPALPFDGTFDYNPKPTDTFRVVELTNAKVPGGYDAIRAHAFGDLSHAFDATTPGTLVIESIAAPSL